MDLADEEVKILKLMHLARLPIPREAILQAVDFSATPFLRNLIALGAIEVVNDGIEISGVISQFFVPDELSDESRKSFHRAAFKAYSQIVDESPKRIDAAVEAGYHGNVAGIPNSYGQNLRDGSLAVANQFFITEKYDEASKILTTLLERHRSLDVLRLAAMVEARRKNYDATLRYAKEVFSRNKKDTKLLSDLGKISLWQYRDDIAEKLVKIGRDASVEDYATLIVEGRVFLRRNNLPQAEIVFEKAMKLTTWDPWPFFFLGSVYNRLGQSDKAIDVLYDGREFCHKVNTKNPTVYDAILTQLALAYFYDNRLDLAESTIRSVLEETPTNPEAIRVFAAISIKKDGIQMAHKALEKLKGAQIKNKIDRCLYHLFYGLFYLGIDDQEKAAIEFRAAHASDKANVYVMIKLANSLYEITLSKWSEGNEDYKNFLSDCVSVMKKILEFNPGGAEVENIRFGLHKNFGVEI